MLMIPRLSSLGFGFRFIITKGLPSFVQHSFRLHGLIQDTHVGSYTQVRIASASRRMSSRKTAWAESKISEAKDAHRKPLLPHLTGS